MDLPSNGLASDASLAWDASDVIRRESDRFSEVLAATDPDASVPSCPEWTAADLAWHLAEVHWFWAEVLSTGATTDEQIEAIEAAKPARPAGMDEILAFRAEQTERLLAELARLDDAETRWTWTPLEQSVGFTRRMQTHEATMHRVDAELAAGVDVSPISPEVAAGAVGHALQFMWHWIPDWVTDREVTTALAIDATDTGERWVAELGRWRGVGPESGRSFDEAFTRLAANGGEGSGVTPEATFAGRAEDLALWMWGRAGGDAGRISSSGNPEALVAFEGVVAQGMP